MKVTQSQDDVETLILALQLKHRSGRQEAQVLVLLPAPVCSLQQTISFHCSFSLYVKWK